MITDKCWHLSDQLVNWVNLIFTGLNDIFAILFIFCVAFTVFSNDGFHLGDNTFRLIDGLFETGLLRLDLNAYLNIVLRLLDFVFYVKNYSGAFLLFGLNGLKGQDRRNGEEKKKSEYFFIHFPCLRYIMKLNSIKFHFLFFI